VAQEVSEDPATRNSGGDLGFFGHGDVDSSFERTAFALKPGQMSDVVETSFGFHVIRVEEVDTTRHEVHARHILIRVPVTPADEQRATALANKVYDEASKGMDFGALVRKYSKFRGPQDPNGDLGFVPVTAFSPDFRAALDSLEIGQVTPPLKNPQGLHIFKVLDRHGERPYELDEIRSQLPELVRQVKLTKQYDTWVAGLRTKARVEIR
jgi:peptidyl-prolyl cis-trans isomerase SurA